MRVYLAGSSQEQERLRRVAERLKAAGHEVTSSWLSITDMGDGTASHLDHGAVAKQAYIDLADIDRADAVLMMVPGDHLNLAVHSGGRHVEVGYALGKEKPVLILGTYENIFQRGCCFQFYDIEEAIGFFKYIPTEH